MSGRPQPRHAPGVNYDPQVVDGFGSEWQRFHQRSLDEAEALALFTRYFAIFPWEALPADAAGFDAGCGSGRWARFVAPRVGTLHCVDASAEALAVAREALAPFPNCVLHLSTVDSMPMPDGTLDFGYSLGVLHHIPDTMSALRACVRKLKPGAPFLLYLYYAFDNRPAWFRAVWKASDTLRSVLSRAPRPSASAARSATSWPRPSTCRWRDRRSWPSAWAPRSNTCRCPPTGTSPST
jgi:SAM-dependent methyltransferase